MDIKKTPLYGCHEANGAKFQPFAGYAMPIQYPAGILKEHQAVREAVGMFDVSHMGEFKVSGDAAREFLSRLGIAYLGALKPGRIKYNVLVNEEGYAVDDILIFCVSETEFMCVVNAANKEKDWAWMQAHLLPGVELRDISDDTAVIAVQGPQSTPLLSQYCDLPTRYYSYQPALIEGVSVLISKTGYTGEEGYEIYLEKEDAVTIWDLLLEAGVQPCGLGARDTLRLEAGFPLYGHELTANTTPLDAGLSRFVSTKHDYLGRTALEQAIPQTLIGFEIVGRQIAREHAPVYQGDVLVGEVTSGTFSPSLQKGIGFARLKPGVTADGLTVEIRGKRVPITMVTPPFVKKGEKA